MYIWIATACRMLDELDAAEKNWRTAQASFGFLLGLLQILSL